MIFLMRNGRNQFQLTFDNNEYQLQFENQEDNYSLSGQTAIELYAQALFNMMNQEAFDGTLGSVDI